MSISLSLIVARPWTLGLDEQQLLANVTDVKVELYGSLGQTGVGHGSGKAVILGPGYDAQQARYEST